MFRFVFKPENATTEDIVNFLREKNSPNENKIAEKIYQDANGHFHLLGAMEKAPNNTTIYSLTEKDYFDFIKQFQPTVESDKDYEDDINDAIREALIQLILAARAIIDKKETASKSLKNKPKKISFDNGLKEYLNNLPDTLLKSIATLPIPESSKLSENKTSIIQSVQDVIWIAQSSATSDALKFIGTKASTTLAVSSHILGVAFGVVTGAFMGVCCGILSAKIYENRAKKRFEDKNNRKPTAAELKLIQRDAKHVGHSIFYGMTFWSLFAGMMECSLYVAKATANFHPIGLVTNVLISITAGVGQAVGACTQQFAYEKEKCTNENGKYDPKKWDAYKKSSRFILSMVKTAISSFFVGFAWGMISTFVPAPLKHAFSAGAKKIAEVFIKMTYRTIGAGLATLGITLFVSKMINKVGFIANNTKAKNKKSDAEPHLNNRHAHG